MIGYLVFLTISTGLYAVFALGLNLQWGFTGLINFGHVAFMTIGAYTTVLLSIQGVPLFLAVLIGAIASSLLGLLIGISTLRLREDYLAIVTIGVSELIRLVALNEEWLTKGAFGVQRYPLPWENFEPNPLGKLMMMIVLSLLAIFTLWQLWRSWKRELREQRQIQGASYQPRQPISLIIWGAIAIILLLVVYITGIIAIENYTYKSGLMLLVLIALAIVYFGLELLVNSPWGRVLKAIREDEEIPRALGKKRLLV